MQFIFFILQRVKQISYRKEQISCSIMKKIVEKEENLSKNIGHGDLSSWCIA